MVILTENILFAELKFSWRKISVLPTKKLIFCLENQNDSTSVACLLEGFCQLHFMTYRVKMKLTTTFL